MHGFLAYQNFAKIRGNFEIWKFAIIIGFPVNTGVGCRHLFGCRFRGCKFWENVPRF